MGNAYGADFGGARGSNVGDQFHELWTLQQVLELLNPASKLRSVAVEGVATSEAKGVNWDGVDCSLCYGDERVEYADEVHLVQLKYSAAKPQKDWTVARLTES